MLVRRGGGGGGGGRLYPRSDTSDQAQCVAGDEVVGRLSLSARRRGRLGGIRHRRGFTQAHVPIRAARRGGRGVTTATGSGALGSAGGPKHAQLLAQLGAGSGPIRPDVIPQVLDMPLDVHLVLLEPANVELLAGGATLKLSGDVFLIVAHDSVEGGTLVSSRGKGLSRGFFSLSSLLTW